MSNRIKIICIAEFFGTIIVSMANSFVKTYFYDETQSGSIVPIMAGVFIAIILMSEFSGSHFNSAVTCMLYWIEDDPRKKEERLELMPYYFSAQFAGAIIGGLISAVLYDGNIQIMNLAEGISHSEGFMFEFLGSYIFYSLLVVNIFNEQNSKSQDKAIYAFISVMGLGAGNAVSCHYTVAGVNPAVASGFVISRIITTEKYYLAKLLWFYILAPVAAAYLVAWCYINIYKFYFDLKDELRLGKNISQSLSLNTISPVAILNNNKLNLELYVYKNKTNFL